MRWLTVLTIFLPQYTAARQCGVPVGMTKIVGGQGVPVFTYPWYVALMSPTSAPPSVSCGGSLITSSHVLTAAHCFPKNLGVRPEKLYIAVFHLVNRCEQTNPPSSAITRVNIYPSFNPQTLLGDLAIITLEKEVTYTPVCLPVRNSIPTGKALIIGFGSRFVKSPIQYPCIMQEAMVNILTKRQCVHTDLAPQYSNIPGTICAGVLRGGVDSCDGDSGGPLQTVGSNGAYTVQGIVSFGEGCARKDLPGVYTEVSAYIDFIDKITHSSSEDSSDKGGGNTSPTKVSPTSPHTHSFLGLLQGLLHPWTHVPPPDSSSGGGSAPAATGGSDPGWPAPQRPRSPLQVFLHGIADHRRHIDRISALAGTAA